MERLVILSLSAMLVLTACGRQTEMRAKKYSDAEIEAYWKRQGKPEEFEAYMKRKNKLPANCNCETPATAQQQQPPATQEGSGVKADDKAQGKGMVEAAGAREQFLKEVDAAMAVQLDQKISDSLLGGVATSIKDNHIEVRAVVFLEEKEEDKVRHAMRMETEYTAINATGVTTLNPLLKLAADTKIGVEPKDKIVIEAACTTDKCEQIALRMKFKRSKMEIGANETAEQAAQPTALVFLIDTKKAQDPANANSTDAIERSNTGRITSFTQALAVTPELPVTIKDGGAEQTGTEQAAPAKPDLSNVPSEEVKEAKPEEIKAVDVKAEEVIGQTVSEEDLKP